MKRLIASFFVLTLAGCGAQTKTALLVLVVTTTSLAVLTAAQAAPSVTPYGKLSSATQMATTAARRTVRSH